MYRRPKFLEVLLDIRRDMALEADHDVALFVEQTRAELNTADAEAEPVISDDALVGEHQNVEIGASTRA